MRNLKFRASREGSKTWLYFDMSHHLSDDSGVPPDFLQYGLDLKTVCQSTNMTDKKGNEIFEGDVIGDWTETDKGCIQSSHTVYFDDETGMFRLDTSFEQNRTHSFPLWKELRDFDYEVISNIYDK